MNGIKVFAAAILAGLLVAPSAEAAKLDLFSLFSGDSKPAEKKVEKNTVTVERPTGFNRRRAAESSRTMMVKKPEAKPVVTTTKPVVVEKVVEKPVVVEKVVEKPVYVERVVTNVIERVVTNTVEKVVEKPMMFEVERVVTNTVEKVVEKPVTLEVERIVTNTVEKVVPVERVITEVVTNCTTNVVQTYVVDTAKEDELARQLKASEERVQKLSRVISPETVKQLTGRPPVIRAAKTYYDRKGGFAVFTGKVHVDDEEYQMHAQKAYAFFEGTNELKRLVAIGHVALTNGMRRAYGEKVSYYRDTGMLVMHAGENYPAEIRDESKVQDQSVKGKTIRFWTHEEQVEVVEADITAPKAGGQKNLGLPGLKR